MTTLIVILYAFICGAMLMMSVLGLVSAISTPSLDQWSKRFFIILFAVLVLASLSFFLELAGYLNPDFIIFEAVAYFIQSLFYVVPFFMLTIYLLHCSKEDWRRSPLFYSMLVLWILYIALIIASQFTPVFYYIESGTLLSLGPAYPLLVAPLLAMLLLELAATVRRRAKLPHRYYLAFLACLLPVTLAALVHIVVSSFLLTNIGLTISAFAMYRIIESDAAEQSRRHQQEIADQRARIAVLQMRPHFIYNTMMSIYYLCDQDPQLAKQVTMDFTSYLRKNFTAVTSATTISFTEELEHTRAYLAVEKAQFEDDLFVDYDTPHIQFRVPPLTLQPLVENAVKHCMDLDSGPLHIWVRTRETDAGSEVVVEDDGPGFDPAIADDPSTTLANIRQRLDMMCGGTLDITRREGGGSIVKVTVPKEE